MRAAAAAIARTRNVRRAALCEMCGLVCMARRSGRAPTAQSRPTNGRLTGHIHRLQKVIQKSRARIPHPRTARGRRRRGSASPRWAEAARAAGAPAPGPEPSRLDRPDRGCPVGRTAAADGGDLTAELRLAAPEVAGLGRGCDKAAWLPVE